MQNLAAHSRPPQLIALLFCREVIVEKTGHISPFRLIEAANVNAITKDEAAADTAAFKLFSGISCFGANVPHSHVLTLRVFYPDGILLDASEMVAGSPRL